jgi:hypothetical protein
MPRLRPQTVVVVFFVIAVLPSGSAWCWQYNHPNHFRHGGPYRTRPPAPPGVIAPGFPAPEIPSFGGGEPEFLSPYSAPPSPRAPPSWSHGLTTPTLSQGMAITVTKALSEKFEPSAKPSPLPINNPRQAAHEISVCWNPPLPARGETVEVTIRFGFSKNGTVVWPPRITYLKAPQGASMEVLRASILDAIKSCTPLPFTASMAANMPGYPLSVRFIGRRADEAEDRRQP